MSKQVRISDQAYYSVKERANLNGRSLIKQIDFELLLITEPLVIKDWRYKHSDTIKSDQKGE